MSAVMGDGHGVLVCNHNVRKEPECTATFDAFAGESVVDAEARARAAGWATFEFYGDVAHFCPIHHG